MTKEELLEMVNATISGNGKQEITGLSLNLALTEIINAMGTGGGNSEIVYFLPSYLASLPGSEDPSLLSTEDTLNELVLKNIELYQKLSNAYHEGKLMQVCTDLSFFYKYYGTTMTVVIPSTVISTIVNAAPMSTNPRDYYAEGEIAILIIPQSSMITRDMGMGEQVDFWLLPNGFVELVYTEEDA